ncbi:hypothetical protein HPP92_007998 [Vanilla planifolia]|uniref:Auxin efflux carrier component n=1 Tax=Vanilla planifolia TaxID=51239 RepID=A0A835V8B7_VANPL|nr:hypothetical protein HPP92_007998 [Vanilla planifolia]
MISLGDFYNVMTAVVPLYVAMILAYGSVKWGNIFTQEQCAGINRFVALFAVPLLSFHFISSNDPYAMNLRFIAADTLQKLMVLAVLTAWGSLTGRGSLEGTITLFSLSTLPNTLVMGIPLLRGMYGELSGSLMVQIVVLQCIIWYTLMLFMFEYRGARQLISEQFPDTAASIVSIAVEPDVLSLDGRRNALETDAVVKQDRKVHVTVRRSSVSRSDIYSRPSGATPRPSNLTNAEIYSLQSSRNPTPRGSSFNHTDFFSMVGNSSNFAAADAYWLRKGAATPRPSNFDEEIVKAQRCHHLQAPSPTAGGANNHNKRTNGTPAKPEDGMGKDLHMFVWSSSASPASDVFSTNHNNAHILPTVTIDQYPDTAKEVSLAISPTQGTAMNGEYVESDDFSFGNRGEVAAQGGGGRDEKTQDAAEVKTSSGRVRREMAMPPTSVMTRLILIMVWRKLIRNPNTYSSLIGVIWALVSYRWNIEMPAILSKSISILSDAGLGMAMFSLGLFMALQPRIIACGNKAAALAMGGEVPRRASHHVCRLLRHRPPRRPPPCCHRTGGAASGDRPLRLR